MVESKAVDGSIVEEEVLEAPSFTHPEVHETPEDARTPVLMKPLPRVSELLDSATKKPNDAQQL